MISGWSMATRTGAGIPTPPHVFQTAHWSNASRSISTRSRCGAKSRWSERNLKSARTHAITRALPGRGYRSAPASPMRASTISGCGAPISLSGSLRSVTGKGGVCRHSSMRQRIPPKNRTLRRLTCTVGLRAYETKLAEAQAISDPLRREAQAAALEGEVIPPAPIGKGPLALQIIATKRELGLNQSRPLRAVERQGPVRTRYAGRP